MNDYLYYIYAGCKWPPQRITGDSYEIFNFGRPLPSSKENSWNSEFRIEWNKDNLQQLVDLAPKYTWAEIGDELGVTAFTARNRYQTLVRQGKAPQICKTKRWAEDEIEYLIAHFNDNYKSLSKKLKRGTQAIAWKIRDLKLPRDGYTIDED